MGENKLIVGKKYKLIKQSKVKDPEMLALLAMSGEVNKGNIHLFEEGIPYFPPSKLMEGGTFKVTDRESGEYRRFILESGSGVILYYNPTYSPDSFEFELIENHLSSVENDS